MSRPRLELQPTYGKLTVVNDIGGNMTLVRCECGTQKWVLRTNLRAGRIKSCGKPGCRVYTTGATPVGLRRSSHAPSWLPTDAIPGLYRQAQELGAVPRLAAELQVSDTTIYNLLTTIKDHGGLDAYMRFLSSDAAAEHSTVASALAPGEVHAPPAVFDPSTLR